MENSVWRAVDDFFSRKDFAGAVKMLEERLARQEAQKFSCLVGSHFSNPLASVLRELNGFIEAASLKFEVRATYLEMNGFDINYDRWYFDFFAYSSYQPDDQVLDWLPHWQSEPWPAFELKGLEPAQEAFAWYHEQRIWDAQPNLKPVYEAAMLLVMAKFAAFVGSVLASGKLAKAVPVLASAHEFDSIARYEPTP